MRHLKTTLAVLGAVTVLVLAGNTIALATTGHSFILGASNSANKATTLTRTTSGPALNIHTKSTSNAPFAVNGHGKVANLNADLLDGLDSGALLTRTYVFTRSITVPTASFTMTAPVPPGTYLVNYSAFLKASPLAAMGDVDCFLRQWDGVGFHFVGESFFQTPLVDAGLTGTGVLVKTSNPAAYLQVACNDTTSVPFVTAGAEPIQLTLTRIDSVSNASARVVPRAARLAH